MIEPTMKTTPPPPVIRRANRAISMDLVRLLSFAMFEFCKRDEDILLNILAFWLSEPPQIPDNH